MKKRTKQVVLILCCLGMWLTFSNKIVLNVSQRNHAMETRFSEEDFKKDAIYYSIDLITSLDGSTEDAYIAGWAFAVAKEDNSQRKVTLYLVGNHDAYAIEVPDSTLFYRPDVVQAFPEGTHGSNQRYGFTFTTSTLSIRDGDYKLYVYCEENDYEYGLADTGITLVKSGVSIECQE